MVVIFLVSLWLEQLEKLYESILSCMFFHGPEGINGFRKMG